LSLEKVRTGDMGNKLIGEAMHVPMHGDATSASPNLSCRVAEEETADYANEREFGKSGGSLQ